MSDGNRHSEANTVFVYGALRSGTTVLKIMLAAHPRLKNPGEVDFLFDYLQRDESGEWHYDVDALAIDRVLRHQSLTIPQGLDGLALLENLLGQLDRKGDGLLILNVHRHAAKILAALPRARFIHLLRDPRDVARSSIGMGWAGTPYHGVSHWIRTEQSWDAISDQIPPEDVHTVRYEDLITGTDTALRDLCDFLGFPFDPAMLDYHEGSTYAAPDRSLIEQWKTKASSHEVALVEGRVADLMTARGYVPVTGGIAPPLAESIRLSVLNKVRVWAFGSRRYGVLVYFSEKLSRWLGLRKLNRRLKDKINQRTVQFLK